RQPRAATGSQPGEDIPGLCRNDLGRALGPWSAPEGPLSAPAAATRREIGKGNGSGAGGSEALLPPGLLPDRAVMNAGPVLLTRGSFGMRSPRRDGQSLTRGRPTQLDPQAGASFRRHVFL
ncbi:unnamed protein product, partial [Ixodes pacificus]